VSAPDDPDRFTLNLSDDFRHHLRAPNRPTPEERGLIEAHTRAAAGGLRPENTAQDLTWFGLLGYDHGSVLTPFVSPQVLHGTWGEAVGRLRTGLEVRVECSTTKHRMYLHPDGTVTMLDHPGRTTPPGGHAMGLHYDEELFTHALDGTLPYCVRVALWMNTLSTEPELGALLRAHLHTDPIVTWRENALRSAYCAVAWAQMPVWPRDVWRTYIQPGVAPALLGSWVAQGWAVNDATLFLSHQVNLGTAEPWRQAGEVCAETALAAACGRDLSEVRRWREVFPDPDLRQAWTKWAWLRPGRTVPRNGEDARTVDDAWWWHTRGMKAAHVPLFEALPLNPPAPDSVLGSRNRPGNAYGNLDRERALAWVQAGVPQMLVPAWFRETRGDLAVALAWAPWVEPTQYRGLADRLRVSPNAPTSEQALIRSLTFRRNVGALARTGMPVSLLVWAAESGLTQESVLRHLSMLPHGRRWESIELRTWFWSLLDTEYRNRPQRTTTVTSALRSRARPSLLETLYGAVRADRWDIVVQAMRRSDVEFLWDHYIQWASDPAVSTPPARRDLNSSALL
jgi:hypothetical protein